ncbi:MAG: hypothetical protein JXA94_06825 [Parachlamydiales bacterium]|nr:hypothetical protein [Parachlamydiales bacterium]
MKKKLSLIFMFLISFTFVFAQDLYEILPVKKQKTIDVLLLVALPASGKSEVRKFVKSYSKEDCESIFGIKDTVQLDDFPYVHMMRRISEELSKRNLDPIFFLSPVLPFKNPFEWGTLMHLINEDYDDLLNHNIQNPESKALWILKRLDRARQKVGIEPVFENFDRSLLNELASALEKDSEKLLFEKNKEIEKGYLDKTVIIEFARGGAYDSSFPLPEPYGYKYAFSQLSDDILKKASVLYIWVSPEESRRKNEKRADPNDPGSILHHSVPLAVMYTDYGCDDFEYLLDTSSVFNTIEVLSHGNTYFLPATRFDNRIDKTSFVRDDFWNEKDISSLSDSLIKSFKPLLIEDISFR